MPESREHGSMVPMIGALVFAGLVVLFLAVEVGRLATAWRSAAYAADAAARAGAAVLDVEAAYSGALTLDPDAAAAVAVAEAVAVRPASGRTATATADFDRICVTVRQPHDAQLLRPLGIVPALIEVTGCAAPAEG